MGGRGLGHGDGGEGIQRQRKNKWLGVLRMRGQEIKGQADRAWEVDVPGQGSEVPQWMSE